MPFMAAADNPFPGASAFTDARGKPRWRFRSRGRTVPLPGDPAASPANAEAYQAAVEGRERQTATVTQHPGAVRPFSFRAAWRIVTTKTPEWLVLAPQTRVPYAGTAERFLTSPVVPGSPCIWGEMDIRDLRRKDVKMILAERAAEPHAAKHTLRQIRRMIDVALDQEWIEVDPSYRVKWSPKTRGHRCWTMDELLAYQARHALGTPARTAYAIALWLGNRRSDVAPARVEDLLGDTARVVQVKTGTQLDLPIAPALREALDALPHREGAAVLTAWGKPSSVKGLTTRMRKWTAQAGLAAGCTLHGLRKTLAVLAAESQATGHELMDMLGHRNLSETTLYTRGAEQKRLAKSGFAKLETSAKVIKLRAG